MSRILTFIGMALVASSAPGCGDEPPHRGPFEAEAFEWTYVPVSGARCRDGRDTGVVVNLNPASDRVMIYLEGGGACFNRISCATNPATFDPEAFGGKSRGIFDRSNDENPVADWNFVYVPYCTGDVHIGDASGARVPGIAERQQFVGHRNMRLALERITSTFPAAGQVLLTGASAGGFGAAGNYSQTQEAFGPTSVTLLDDSGPPMDAPWLSTCLLASWVDLFRLDRTLLEDCGDACPDPSRFLHDYLLEVFSRYPDGAHGLFSYTADFVIRLFFSFGMNDCRSALPAAFPEEDYFAGLEDLRQLALEEALDVGTFYLEGDGHTILDSVAFYSAEAAGVRLVDWVAELVRDGETAHVGP